MSGHINAFYFFPYSEKNWIPWASKKSARDPTKLNSDEFLRLIYSLQRLLDKVVDYLRQTSSIKTHGTVVKWISH